MRRASKLPAGKTWDTFEHERAPVKLRQQLVRLAEGDFVDRGVNVLALDGAPLARSRPTWSSPSGNPVLPGVGDYLASAKDMGLRLAVASSSSPGWAVGHLEQRSLLHYFEFVLSHGDVTNGKPDPELYTMSLTRLGVRPQNAFAIEDSVNGLTAAKAAGLQCVVVPNPMTRGMDFGLADICLDALSDLPLKCLLEELEYQAPSGNDDLSKAKV